jgi:hypothetical protein
MRTARSARDANQLAQSHGFDWREWFVPPIVIPVLYVAWPADGKAPLRAFSDLKRPALLDMVWHMRGEIPSLFGTPAARVNQEQIHRRGRSARGDEPRRRRSLRRAWRSMGTSRLGPSRRTHGLDGLRRLCGGDGTEMADHFLVHIEHKVKPTDAQKVAFEELKDRDQGRR